MRVSRNRKSSQRGLRERYTGFLEQSCTDDDDINYDSRSVKRVKSSWQHSINWLLDYERTLTQLLKV